MKEKSSKWQIVSMLMALVLVVAVIAWAAIPRTAVVADVEMRGAQFGKQHYNTLKVDTFVNLLQQAYGSLVRVQQESQQLKVTLNANELTRDFFNSNDAILKWSTSDYGFEIRYNQEQKSVAALFNVSDQRGVNVPNDVLIKLMDKTTNHVNQSK
jgi:hypothetical protein